jgi:hypothetical protein
VSRFKELLVAGGWILLIGIPMTALALMGVVFLMDVLPGWIAGLQINWNALSLEGSARWPELAGMLIGQLLIMAFLFRRFRPSDVTG